MIISALLILCISVVVWKFLQDRLNSFRKFPPGPWGIPILGYLPFLLPDPHVKVGKVARKYGNIFYLQMAGYKFVVLNDFETIRDAFRKLEFAGRPSHLTAFSVVSNGIGFAEGHEAMEQRKFAIRALHKLGLGSKTMESVTQEQVSNFISYFSKNTGKPIDLTHTLAISVVNGIWGLSTGQKWDLYDPNATKLYADMKEKFQDEHTTNIFFFFPRFACMFPNFSGYNRMKSLMDEFRKNNRILIEQHMKSFNPEAEPRDFIDAYIAEMQSCTDPKSGFYKERGIENLCDTLINFFIGGSDTVTCSFMFGILYLMKNPELMERLQNEVDSVVGKSRPLEFADKERMPFTEAVMYEIYRLSSIVPTSVLHMTMTDVNFKGFHLPKDTIIMPNLYAVHHDPEYWEDPEDFRPQRFLDENGNVKKDERLIPFSIGKRYCIGDVLAHNEFFLFLTGLLQNFNVKAHPDYPLPSFEARPGLVLSPQFYKVVLEER